MCHSIHDIDQRPVCDHTRRGFFSSKLLKTVAPHPVSMGMINPTYIMPLANFNLILASF